MRDKVKDPVLTDVEILFMKLIWQRGPSTVREVRSQLPEHEKRAITTIATFLNILVSKGFLCIEAVGRSHVFAAKITEFEYQDTAVSHVKRTLFEGSTLNMVRAIVLSSETTNQELSEIRETLHSRLQ